MKNKYMKFSITELLKIETEIIKDPKNQRNDRYSLYLYTPKARKKLDDIAWAIYAKKLIKIT